jgi:Ca-activated chloride channel family protein
MSARLLLCVFLALAAAAAAPLAQQPGLVIETKVIGVPVTVLDRRGQFVPGLRARDFEILEDGVTQELTSFSIEDTGIAAVMLIDVSDSMIARLPEARRAALQFVRLMGPNDVLKIMTFDDRVRTLADFTSNQARLEAALSSIDVGGSTALHDALWTALATLDARRSVDEAAQRHRAVLVLSDGDDTASGLRYDEVLVRARRVDAVVSSLSLNRDNQGNPALNAPSTVFLRTLADQSGGQLLFPDLVDLERSYRDLADELRHQYSLGYVPKNSDVTTRYRRITVKVLNRGNFLLRHRQGYVANR